MKSIFHIILLSLYFFTFLLTESTANLYLSWDRIYPQFFLLSIINTVSFIYLFKSNLLILSLSSALKERIVICYSIFILASLISIAFAFNQSESLITFSKYLTYFISLLSIYSLAKALGNSFLRFFLFLSITALFIESFSIVYNAIDRVIINGLTYERDNFLLRTFAGNINVAANSIVSKIMLVYLIIYTFKDKRLIYMSYLLLLIAFSSLFLLLTRSAFLSLFLLTFAFMIFNYKKLIKSSIPIFLTMLISYLFVNSTFNTENPDEIVSRVSSISVNTQDESINERLGYYSNALEVISEYPIFGIGIGNWKIKSIDLAGQSVVGYTVPYHVHNDFLQISAEIGIIGGLFYLLIYMIPVYRLIIRCKDKVLDNLNLAYVLIISAIFIDSMLNFPIARPINHIFLLFTLVAFILNSKSSFHHESY